MKLHQIRLVDFRSHADLSLELAEGLTAVIGPNGAGKTNLLEAIGVLSRLRSFRGVPNRSYDQTPRGTERSCERPASGTDVPF